MKFHKHFVCFCFLVTTLLIFGTVVITAQNQTAKTETVAPDLTKDSITKPLSSLNENLSKPSADSESIDFNSTNRIGIQTVQTQPLSLNDAIRKALESNNSIEVARDDVRYQETQLRSLLGFYDPVFTIAPTFTRSSTTDSTPTSDFRLNSDFSQQLRSGGSYRVFFNNSRTENRFAQAQLSSGSTLGSNTSNTAIYSSSFGTTFTQPLFRNLKINNTRRLIKIQRKRLQQSDADFRRQTIDTISQVQRAYWDLVFALRDQQNRLANLNLARENLRQIEARIEAGAAAPLARAEVATELAQREGDVLLATQQVSTTENILKTLLLREPTAPEWSQSFVPTDQPVISDQPILIADAVKDAISNRPELNRLRFQREINSIDIDYYKNQTKPRIDLNSTFSLDGLATNSTNAAIVTNTFTRQQDLIFLDRINQLIGRNPGITPISNTEIVIPPSTSPTFGGYNQAFRNIFRTDAPNFSVGVTIQFPLRNTTAEADLAGAKILQQQNDAQLRSQEQTVVAEVRNAVQAVETARQRVFTARLARENAAIQLEGERRLFEAGRSTQFLLFQRENTLTNARNAEIRAETDYNKALSDLQKATSTTFQLNNIEVQSPLNDR